MAHKKVFDERDRRVIIVAPCLLNPSLVACGYYNSLSFEVRKKFIKKLIDICYKQMVSIDIYACPEYTVAKLPRPSASKGYYERFKIKIRKIARELVGKIKDYNSHGIKVLAIVGIEGSPCCGVNTTKYGRVWTKEDIRRFLDEYKIGKDLTEGWYKHTYNDGGSGVFMECLLEELKKNNLHIPIFGFSNKSMQSLLTNIKRLI